MLDKLIFKTFELHNFSETLCQAYTLEQQSFSDGYWEESLPEGNYKIIWKYSSSIVVDS